MTREEEIRKAVSDIFNDEKSKSNGDYANFDIIEYTRRIAEWFDTHPKSPWISVNDRLPDKINKFMSEPVLCRYTRGSKEYFHVSQYDFEFNEWQISNVTHWMPIPELKKGGEQ